MKSLVTFWLIFSAILLSCFYPNHVSAHDEKWHPISTERLAAKIKQGDDICLVNVLPKIIYDNRHIPGSINIPVSEILTSPLMPQEKSKPLIFYCMGTL